MGIFTKEEKYNKETGKFETTKKGLFKERKQSLTKQLQKQYYEKHPKERPSYKRSEKMKQYAKTGNKILDTVFGPPPNKKKATSKTKNTGKKNYYVKNGIAYPIARPKTEKKSKKNQQYDPFGNMFDFGYGTSKKGKKRDFDLFDNYGFL